MFATTIEGELVRTRTMKREPTTPGEILREEFLAPLAMTQRELAQHLGCDVKVINRLVNGRTALTAELAIKLGAAFDTTPEFWLNAQKAVDLHRAARRIKKLPRPVRKAS
jgi:addiction module HigA family antidote